MTSPQQPGRREHETPIATYAQVDRLGVLLAELSDLLDGSLRLLAGAKTALAAHGAILAAGGAGHVERDLAGTAERLERMNELVHAAMQNATRPLGSTLLARSRPVTMGEAIQHAADVLAPLARERNVALVITGAPATDALPAGALYTVVLNGIQNAIEAVAARPGGSGTVEVSVRPDSAPRGVGYGRDRRDWYVLEIVDDGIGPPADTGRCFDLGFSTKPRGTGVGLAVARSVVQGMGGTIELVARKAAGAVLRVRFPSLAVSPNLALGGAA